MNIKQLIIATGTALALCVPSGAHAQAPAEPFIRLAELEIDPAHLDRFNAAVTEGVQAAVRLEPGVLALYVVAEKEHPNRVRVFEMYTSAEAYQTHLQTPHFRKFRDTTDKLVKSRKLLDAVPVVLGAKPRAAGSAR